MRLPMRPSRRRAERVPESPQAPEALQEDQQEVLQEGEPGEWEEPAAPPAAAGQAWAPRRRLVFRPLPVGLAVLALLLAGLAAWLIVVWSGYGGRTDVRAAVLAAARQEITDFTTFDYRNIDDYCKRVERGSSGGFHQQFSSACPKLKSALAGGQGSSSGRILEAAVEGIKGKSATVLVAVDVTVRNSDVPQGDVKHLRYKVSLAEGAGGKAGWTVDGVVPA